MGTILHLLIALSATWFHTGPGLATPSLPAGGAPVAIASALEPAPAPLEIVGLPEELVGAVNWAVGLFGHAELTLPPLRFVDHGDDQEPCGGYHGVHQVRGNRSVIGLCALEPGPFAETTILHELSHAWLEHQLTTSSATKFQALRGYEHWRDRSVAWHENGCEQAAEIMVWGLIDRPIGIITINDHSCDDLDAGYRTLTGTAPLHGFRNHC